MYGVGGGKCGNVRTKRQIQTAARRCKTVVGNQVQCKTIRLQHSNTNDDDKYDDGGDADGGYGTATMLPGVRRHVTAMYDKRQNGNTGLRQNGPKRHSGGACVRLQLGYGRVGGTARQNGMMMMMTARQMLRQQYGYGVRQQIKTV